MGARCLQLGETVDARRGDAVVCLSEGPPELVARTVESVAAHTPDEIAVLRHPPGEREQGAAVAAAAPADVVLMRPGTIVADGWLGRLTAAADGDPAIASASALSGDGAGDAVAGGLAAAAARIVTPSPRRPRLPAASGPCVLVRRSALELIGGFPAPGGAAFSAACRRRGLHHVLADDVLVAGVSAAGDGSSGDRLAPGLRSRSSAAARRAVDGLAVAIDARALAGPPDGTRRHVLELIAAVAATGAAHVTAIVSPELAPEIRVRLEGLPGVTLTSLGAAGRLRDGRRADIVHRPHQVSAPADLTVLAGLAERLVVTHQDLISFHNPAYFPSEAAWEGYRDLTRRALGVADHVLFFSEHVRADALAEDLVEPQRAAVIRIGADHALPVAAPAAPVGVAPLPAGTEVMLCLGTDFQHKNRVFALRLLAELQRRYGWEGWLVLAGPHVTYGSSLAEERELLEGDPALAAAVVTLGTVSEAEKEWLLRRSALVLYPTVNEGFGLMPYEAAAHDRPCLWAPGTALGEVLPDAVAGIVPWDAAASAERALALIREPAARAANLAAVRGAQAQLTWARTGRQLVDVYGAVCEAPPSPAAVLERVGGLMRSGLSEDAMRLVGPDGLLSPELERPLLALLARPWLAGPASAAIRAGYRLSQRRRR